MKINNLNELVEKIAVYPYISEDTKLDIKGDIRVGLSPNRILQRFIMGCSFQRDKFKGSPEYIDDPDYREILRYLIEAGANPNLDCGVSSVITNAAIKGEKKAVEFLLKKGVNKKNVKIALKNVLYCQMDDMAKFLKGKIK